VLIDIPPIVLNELPPSIDLLYPVPLPTMKAVSPLVVNTISSHLPAIICVHETPELVLL
jgi:hypothetical protein